MKEFKNIIAQDLRTRIHPIVRSYFQKGQKVSPELAELQPKPTMGWKSGLLALTSNPDRDECGKRN